MNITLALYLAVYPALAAGVAWWLRGRGKVDAAYICAFAAAWIAIEWLRSVMFTGYAWDPLGVIWVPVQPVATLAAFVGTYALSGLTVMLAGMLLLIPRRVLPMTGVALGLAILLVAELLSYRSWARPADPSLLAASPRLVVVQPNVSQDQRGDSDGELLLRKLSALSGKPGSAPRLIVWPEGVVRDFIEDGYPGYVYGFQPSPFYLRRRMAALLGAQDMLLAGGTALQFDRDGNVTSASNSVFAIDPSARIVGRYDKAHLVPYGEYLPMPWLLKPLGLARLVPGDMDFIDGPGPRNLALPAFGPIGVQICYEIIFSGKVIDPAHRPRLLFNPSNDAWFGKWGPPQHLAQARMRAIEEGLPIVRATPTGISAVIAADGRLVATVPHERAGAIDVAIPQPASPTLFSRIGNWAALIVALVLAGTAVAFRGRRR